MKLLNAAVGKISQLIKKKGGHENDMASLTEGYLRRYPVRSFGIPVASVEDILLSYKLETKKLIPAAAIRINSERPEEPTFTNLYKKTIANLAEYVHLLPASEYHHHHELGGLFYHSLQTAHGCLEKARSREGKIPRDKKSTNIDVFQVIKPKWIYGAWALGLVHDIGKVIMDITVYEHGNEGNIWSPLNESLVSWAKRTGVKSYETRMTKDRQHGAHEEVGALLVKEVISKEGIEYLRGGGPLLMNQIYQYMSGKYIDGAFLHQIVKHVDGLETARDINMRWDKHLGESRVNVEKIFISSARSLLPTMKVNEAKAKIFICGGRAFVTVAAIDQIIAFAKQENYKQFPSSTKEFCEALMEAGVVEPIRNRDGEATDEWFGILKPESGNEYRVIKLVSPIVIYWEGETPRSIPGEYVIGNTGVREIYSEDGSVQIETDVHDEIDEDSEAESPTESEKDTATYVEELSCTTSTESTSTHPVEINNTSNKESNGNAPAMSEAEMASHLAAMEMYDADEEDNQELYVGGMSAEEVQSDEDIEIPRPKPKKPSVIKSDKPQQSAPPKLETYEPDMDGNNESSKITQSGNTDEGVKTPTQAQKQTKEDKRNAKEKGQEDAQGAGSDNKLKTTKPVNTSENIESLKQKQTAQREKKKQQAKSNIPDTNKTKRKKLNQLEDKFSTYLAEGLSAKMGQGDVVYIDKTFALSVSAISEVTNNDYMKALPQLKARSIISDERGIRKIEVKGEEKVMVVLNQSLVERIVDEKSIDLESIAIIEREAPTVKDKNNRKSDLIAKGEVSENKEDYASQVMQLIQNGDAVIEETDGIYVEFKNVKNIARSFSKENQKLLQAAITKYDDREIDGKTYIRILENRDER